MPKIKYNRKGTKNRHRALFFFENGFVKAFVVRNKKDAKRVRRFRNKYIDSDTWYDQNDKFSNH